MKRLAGVLVLFSAFATANDDDPSYPYTLNPGQMADHPDEMDLSDGVSRHEAGILAVAYYLYYGGLSGAAMPVERKGDWWHSETMVDPGGK